MHLTEQDAIADMKAVAGELSTLVPHVFEIITALGDGTAIPAEALSEDHTVGLYREAIPLKMRENLAGFREIEVADLVPQRVIEWTPTGARADLYLEAPVLRGIRFRAERLQYLDDGWWAVTSEVKYPAATLLAALHAIKKRYGAAHLFLNTELPMPLWVRSAPLGRETNGVEVVIQARGEGRVLFTNIHSECTMEYARAWVQAARRYYRTDDG
jgi:hypothetical protein